MAICCFISTTTISRGNEHTTISGNTLNILENNIQFCHHILLNVNNCVKFETFQFQLGEMDKRLVEPGSVSYHHKIFAGIQDLGFSLVMQIVRKKLCKTVVIMEIIDSLFTFSSPAIINSHSTGGHICLLRGKSYTSSARS